MSTNQPGTIKYVSRQYGDKMAGGVLITCSKCHRTEWKAAHNVGAGAPIFKSKGWLLGRQGANTDVCPTCRNQKQKRPDMTPAMRRAAYNRIEDEHALKAKAGGIRMAGYMTSSVLDPGGFITEGRALDIAEPINPILREKMTQAITEAAHPTERWPALLPYSGKDGALYHVATSGFSRIDNAKRAALKWLGRQDIHEPKQGVDYVITKRGDTYSWHPPNRLPAERDAAGEARGRTPQPEPASDFVPLADPAPVVIEPSVEVPNRKRRARNLAGVGLATPTVARHSARALLSKLGIVNAVEGEHFSVHREPEGTHGFKLLIQIGPAADTPQPETTEDPPPMPAQPLDSPTDAGRTATREQRRAIAELLDNHYDTDTQRYRGDWSDRKVADQLDTPRAFVTHLRTDLYGDYDRNEASERQAKNMDTAIGIAEAATAKLLEMASEAEKIANDLKVARSRLF